MIVRADLDAGTIALVEPDDFTVFHLAVANGGGDDPRLADVLVPVGRLDGDHAWITTDGLIALAGSAADEDWRRGLDGMVAYARDKGFLSDGGDAIRAHIEVD